MAIETSRTLAQLKSECVQKGIEVKVSQPREKKEDYVKALRSYYLNEKYGDKVPRTLQWILSIDCPMLCRRYQECKPNQQKEFWESPRYYAEQKIDGCRCLIMWDSVNKQFDFYSRNNSVKDFLPVSYKDTILVKSNNFDYAEDFILDCEVISTNPNISTVLGNKGVVCATQLQSTTAILSLNPDESREIQKADPLKFVIFDCLKHGKWILDLPLKVRKNYMNTAAKALLDSGFVCEVNPYTVENKREFYDGIIQSGGEGVVFKNMDAKYHASTSRTVDQVKLKRSVKESIGSDIDAWVTGFTKSDEDGQWSSLIGGLEFSVKIRKEDGTEYLHHIASCSNIPLELRKKITVQINGEPSLSPDWYGKVATISGQNVSARALRLQHAVIVCWRPDKNIEGCASLNESELRSMVF